MNNTLQMSVLYRRTGDISFGWNSLDKTLATSYNLYSSPAIAGPYTFVKSIKNNVDKNLKKVAALVKDTDVPLPSNVRYYFKLTLVSPLNVESNISDSPVTIVFPPDIHPFWENEAEEANSHNYAWVEENQRWEKLVQTPDGKLKVDASVTIGSITLSDIQIATLPDNVTKVYLLADSERRTVVSVDPNVYSRLQSFEEHTAIATNVETTILTLTNASQYFVSKIACTGTADGVFKFKINNIVSQVLRNSWNNRNIEFNFIDKDLLIPAGSTVTVSVTHKEKLVQDFECSIFGFTYSY